MTPINFQPAERISHFESYYFTVLGEKIKQLKQHGKDVIRFDIGSPDLPPTKEIVDALYQSAQKANSHGYTMHAGSLGFRKAVAQYYWNRFNVALDSETEILPLIGSKEGLFNLCQCFINPGDLVLVPDPGYPVYEAATKIAGGIPYAVPLLASNQYLVDFSSIPDEVAAKAKMFWLNYPNNPTGAIAPYSFLAEAVDFARKHQILIAFDAPYTEICFDQYRAPSILEVPGAQEVVVEFNSLSKTYNMAGWRIGYACGNTQVLGYLKTYKSQMDSGIFNAVMDAGISALTGDQSWLGERNDIYQQRRDIVVQGLKECGFDIEPPKSSLYVWCRIPAGFASSEEFTTTCLNECGVSFAPGNVYGKCGEGYFRISLCIDARQVALGMSRFRTWLTAGHV